MISTLQLFNLRFQNRWTVAFCEDQNFERATINRSNPQHCPCLLPNGKYVVTSQWRILSSKDCPPNMKTFWVSFDWQEKMLLQGVGMDEYRRYNMAVLTPSQLSNMTGNSSFPQFPTSCYIAGSNSIQVLSSGLLCIPGVCLGGLVAQLAQF